MNKKEKTGFDSSVRRAVSRKEGALDDQTFVSLLRLMRMMQSHMQHLEKAEGLSGAQLLALWQLSVNQSLSVSELASALHLQRSSMSNLLDKLESRGYVSRNRQTHNQRVVMIRITKTGWDVVVRAPGPMRGLLRESFNTLTPQTMNNLHEGVTALVAALDQSVMDRGKDSS